MSVKKSQWLVFNLLLGLRVHGSVCRNPRARRLNAGPPIAFRSRGTRVRLHRRGRSALRLAGWVQPEHIFQLAGLVLAAMLAACLSVQEPAATDRAIMPPAFVVIFSVADAVWSARRDVRRGGGGADAGPRRPPRLARQMLIDTAIAVAATQSRGPGLSVRSASARRALWPWLALPIAAAVVAYHVVQGALANVVVPLPRAPACRSIVAEARAGRMPDLCARRVRRRGARRGDRSPDVGHRAGGGGCRCFSPIAPTADYVHRLEEQHRRREVHRVIWIRACRCSTATAASRCGTMRSNACWTGPRDRALGRPLTDAVPALARTELPRAITETVADRKVRTLNHLRLPAGTGDARSCR